MPLGEVASEKDKFAAFTMPTPWPRPSPGKCIFVEILKVSKSNSSVCVLREIKITQHLVWMSLPSVPRLEDCSGNAILNLKVGRPLGNKSLQ